MAISTADCKSLLAAHFLAHPNLILDIYGSDPANEPEHSAFTAQAVADAQKPVKWKREGKWNARAYFDEYGSTSRQPGGQVVVDVYEGADLKQLPAAEVKVVRKFYLDPSVYDDAVGYVVLETHSGALHIGAYTGD